MLVLTAIIPAKVTRSTTSIIISHSSTTQGRQPTSINSRSIVCTYKDGYQVSQRINRPLSHLPLLPLLDCFADKRCHTSASIHVADLRQGTGRGYLNRLIFCDLLLGLRGRLGYGDPCWPRDGCVNFLRAHSGFQHSGSAPGLLT